MPDNDKFLQMLESEKPNIVAMLPQLNDWLTPERWWSVTYDIIKSPKLMEVAQKNPASLINALKKIASWGLEPDGQECFINVYSGEATPQTMYKGLIRRAIEGGAIAHAVADIIKEGDQVEIVSSTRGRELVHRPAFGLSKGNRKIIGAYCLITLPNGQTDYELFEENDIEAVKGAALRMNERGGGKGLSPAWRFFEGEQCKKSVINRALKRFRGKRDTEAGKLYNKIQTEGDPFDIDRVKAAEKANEDIAAPPNPGRKVEAEVEPPIDKTINDPISDDEQSQLLELARGKGYKTPSTLVRFINAECKIEVDDLDSLKKGQLTKVMEQLGA